MSNFRAGAEKFFDRWTAAVIRFRFPVLLAVLVLSALLAANIRHMEFDTSNEGFLRQDDPILSRLQHL